MKKKRHSIGRNRRIMSLSANGMSSFFPLATGNLRRKKEGNPLADIDVLRHFRPMECLLFFFKPQGI